MKMVKLRIDEIETEAPDRTPLLEVAKKLGIRIPTLCHHPILEPYGACRLCICEVKIRNRTRIVTSCNYPVTDGIEVQTDSARVRRDRTMIIEWLLSRCGQVPVLESLAKEYGVAEPRFGRGDHDCILCGLCVRVCSEIVRANVLGFINRGTTREVSTAYGETSDRCIACGACAYVCPTGCIKIEDEEALLREALPLGPRTPIYIPTLQAVPHQPVIDKGSCIHFKTGGCQVCETVCESKAVDHAMEDTVEDVLVGAVILATGFKTVDPATISRYGYGKYPNVLTALQLEHMVNASGPTGGKVTLKDGTTPRAVGIVHCVGSRDKNAHEYCSRVCCMYSLKLAHLIKERTDAQVFNFYIDMRTPGKGYEEFYLRLLSENLQCIRGRVAEVSDAALSPQEEGRLIVRVEDTLIGMVRRIPVDLLVLSTGLEAQADAEQVRRTFNISCSKDGWFLERHPKLAPVSTFTDGVFLAGACQGPKDIPDTVAQAGAATAAAMALIDRAVVELEPNTAFIERDRCSGCKTCVPLCSFNAIGFSLDAGISEINEALCKGCGTCVAACPSGAAQQNLFTDAQINEEIKGVLAYV